MNQSLAVSNHGVEWEVDAWDGLFPSRGITLGIGMCVEGILVVSIYPIA